jgi:hypothetical protein
MGRAMVEFPWFKLVITIIILFTMFLAVGIFLFMKK